MNEGLKAQIHRYAENREIDYMSAKNLGNAYGIEFRSEQELVEFKTIIDNYLKTFNEDAFEDVERAFNVLEDYDVEVYAGTKKDGEIKIMGGHLKPKTAKGKPTDKKKKKK